MQEFDVVVLGSGAAGLTAAIAAHDAGATVGLYEKYEKVGGTTGLSGGVAWMPLNPFAAAAGVNDTRDEALAYLNSLSNGMLSLAMAEAFVDTCPETIEWLEHATPLRLQLVKGFPDYHPERPGGKPSGGRSIEPVLFAYDALGAWADRITGPENPTTISESPLGGGTGVLTPEALQERSQGRRQGCGRAMIGALLKGCLDRGIAPVTGARARSLLVEQGRITGVTIDGAEGPVTVRARRGVVLATGGFEWDAGLTRDFLKGPIRHPPSLPSNTGDGLKMAMKVGARLGNMREAWWAPVAKAPGLNAYGVQAVSLVLRERTLPRSIMVNRRGVRFTNEAANYNALGAAFHQMDVSNFDYANQPCWLIFDAEFVRRYGGFGLGPGSVPDWVMRDESLAALAGRVGLPDGALEASVARWNAQVAQDRDEDFGRGQSAYDGWSGDQQYHPQPRATLGPIDTGPFYAVEIMGSCLGTNGGPRTTIDGEVIDTDDAVIPGLFAAGNAMASATGMIYGGAGGTLGPALVFGYRAGRRAGGAERR
jgi:succinate dehydrogenase/fumarate reductase flavoprotein subunit